MQKILIIEDEQEIADTLEYAISSEGMQALWVSNGNAAEQTLSEQKIDLCVLDVGLPDCSGFELLKKIRQSSDYDNNVPVLMLTARNEEIDRIVGLEIGADDYVSKPFSPREVVARIKAILKRSQANYTPRSTPIKTNNVETQANQTQKNSAFEQNIQLKKIHYRGENIQLTKAEYSLLSALLDYPQQVFSRRQLIEKVWSSQHPSDDRAIDTHIKTLRAKLRTHNPHTELIVTHRGFGYSLAK